MKRAPYFYVGLGIAMFVCLSLGANKAQAVERYEVLQYGDKDKYVYRLQEELYARGYLKVEPTGYYGLETKKAVSFYQERKGLESDGKAGPVTQKKILGKYFEAIPSSREINNNKEDKSDSNNNKSEKSSEKSSKKSSSSKDATSIRLGDEGESIRDIQKRLRELGYYTYHKTTSYYGSITEEAVLQFQAQNDLTTDGVIGKKTKKLLFSDSANYFKKSKMKKVAKRSTGAKKQSSNETSTKEKVISLAKSLRGKSYRWGATGPNTFDCSGYIYYMLKAHGISTPRTSAEMSRYSSWEKVSRSNLKRGDLVFFSSPGRTSGVGHVGMYLGDGDFIHCSSGKAYSVTVSSLTGSYSTRFQFGRRVF